MAFYHKCGEVPAKKHTVFHQPDKTLYKEELFSSQGFSGIYSTLYHLHPPPKVKQLKEVSLRQTELWEEAPLAYIHFFTDDQKTEGNPLLNRNLLLSNEHIAISTSSPTENSDDFYRNTLAHELTFIHRGQGVCLSEFGMMPVLEGDYLIVPKGVTYQLHFSDLRDVKLLIVESSTPFEIPMKFRNEFGQLLEHAPYSERDFILPQLPDPMREKDDFILNLKRGNRLFQYNLEHHPFDVIGWDGYLYPFTFNIKNYTPIVGMLHQPPPVHMVFSTPHFVVCNFVPRLYDFHPEAIPAPYYHSNIDSDEVLYYVSGNFMSRKGVREGSITLHPMGIPHGPQPGKIEESIGKTKTDEYAVMIDTFTPLSLTRNVQKTMDSEYYRSWL